MRTLEIDIKEEDFLKYNINSDSIILDDLVEKIKNELTKEALGKCQTAAKKSKIGKMTLEDINSEIDSLRNEKRHS